MQPRGSPASLSLRCTSVYLRVLTCVKLSLPEELASIHTLISIHSLPRTHTRALTVPWCSRTIGDGVERCYGSIDGLEQVFGFVSRSFNSALEPGHVICIRYTQTHQVNDDEGLI